jgi:hypothetical protein
LIPGEYTSKLKPMDEGINKPFENHIRAQFHCTLGTNLMAHLSQPSMILTSLIVAIDVNHSVYMPEQVINNTLFSTSFVGW